MVERRKSGWQVRQWSNYLIQQQKCPIWRHPRPLYTREARYNPASCKPAPFPNQGRSDNTADQASGSQARQAEESRETKVDRKETGREDSRGQARRETRGCQSSRSRKTRGAAQIRSEGGAGAQYLCCQRARQRGPGREENTSAVGSHRGNRHGRCQQ